MYIDDLDASICKAKQMDYTPVAVEEEVVAPSYPVWRAYINGNIHPDSPYAKEYMVPAEEMYRNRQETIEKEYRAKCLANWKKEHRNYAKAHSYFRQWKVTYNTNFIAVSCSFQVKKDGANYVDIPLPLHNNTLPALRLFATIFNVPYRNNLTRDQLLEILKPVIRCLCY